MARGQRGGGAKKNKLKIGNPFKAIGNVFKKGKKVIDHVNPNTEINKKINKKAEEIKTKGYHESGRERAQLNTLKRIKSGKTIAQVQADNEAKVRQRAKSTNTDFQAYKKGKMSLSEFIRKNPNSNTAKKAQQKGSVLSRKLASENKNKKKVTKSGYRR